LKEKEEEDNMKIHRYLADNYWDCPILDYSSVKNDDYPTAKSRCGNLIR